MEKSAEYIVGLLAAIAVDIVMVPIFDYKLAAWIICAVILLGLLVTVPMFYLKRKGEAVPEPARPGTASSAPVFGPLIATYDQSIALANEATANYYGTPPGDGKPGEKQADE